MEHHKIPKLLIDLTVTKFVTKKWIKENDLSNRQYKVCCSYVNPILNGLFHVRLMNGVG